MKQKPLKLMYITNQPVLARIAEKNTVSRIWVDLETHGKETRQLNINSVKSNHSMSDVSAIRDVLSQAELLVRVNPLHEKSQVEINEVIERGADILMLPMFHTEEEARRWVDMVHGRRKTIMLVETIGAQRCIESIARIPGVDEIHIGLNDLHLAHDLTFMFELLANGQVEEMTKKIAATGLPFGFGGVAKLDHGILPAQYIIPEHHRLGSSMVILSRGFFDGNSVKVDESEIEMIFQVEIQRWRAFERSLFTWDRQQFIDNSAQLKSIVEQIVHKRKNAEQEAIVP